MDLSKSLNNYLEELSSNAPTPGGGNVAALSGVLACNLGIMVCNLTIGKKKYLEVEDEMKKVKTELENLSNCFIELGSKDNYAFDKVMEAFRLPKETEEEKKARSEKIEEATYAAAVVPSEVIDTCKKTLELLKTVAEKGNKNSVSDAGVAVSLISTSAQGAFLNVLINCSSLKNKTVGNELLKRSEIICNEVEVGCKTLLDEVKKGLYN
ncbi:MAG TPA: cyclodeaminase/cyclohydrolase family protein [Ignavibacteriaceae bacterium]|nr:cyclodeaminase/cyclohydrolase family protein [Ignavibacteriaceae bacterium]